jgi:hypothetical protein
MALIRGHHSFDDHFTQIPNEWLRDSRLSLKAIGLLAQLMSHKPGWNLSMRSLAHFNGTGIGTIKSAVEELEKLGYLVRSDKQGHKDDGTFGHYDWTTSDPFQNTDTVKPQHGEIEHKEEQVFKNTNVKENIRRATKISDDFAVTLDKRKWALDNIITIDIELETKKFIAYYQANDKPMKNWDAAWRNWILKAQDFQRPLWEKMKDKKEFDSRTATDSAKKATKEFLIESQKAAETAAPPPKCEHDKSIVSCMPCLRKLS